MPGRETADIVFCMDASGSMTHLFDAVRTHVGDLIKGLESDLQRKWDVRFDFLSYQTCSCLHPTYRSVMSDNPVRDIYQHCDVSKFFTSDVAKFQSALAEVTTRGDESGPLALSVCLDFPFRDSRACHRVVILLTDEGTETGTHKAEFEEHKAELVQKIQDRHVLLYMVTPRSDGYEFIASVDKCEHTIVADDDNGLVKTDFTELLQSIGKSVSVSQTSLQMAPVEKPLPLFGEERW